MRLNQVMALLAFTATVGIGCSAPANKNSEPTTATALDTTVLPGTWASACIPSASSPYSEKDTNVFTDTAIVKTNVVFSDKACTAGNEMATVNWTGTYTLPAANQLKRTLTNVTLTPGPAATASVWMTACATSTTIAIGTAIDVSKCSYFSSSLNTNVDLYTLTGGSLLLNAIHSYTKTK